MKSRYRYNHVPRRHRLRHLLVTLIISVGVFALIASVVWLDLRYHNSHKNVSGAVNLVPQSTSTPPQITINEPLYSFKLPADWKPAPPPSNDPTLTWAGGNSSDNARTLRIYADNIPSSYPVNRELPVSYQSGQLIYGEISENCSSFTPGGTFDTAQAEQLKPAVSVWQGVNFMCNLPDVVDNQVGTGSAAGINTVVVNGHSYFFLYIDHTINPDYTVLYNAIRSFRPK